MFGHALVGGARLGGFGVSDTGFAGVAGGGVDFSAGGSVSFRMGQFDYVVENTFGSTTHNFRYSAGVIFRFGNR